MASAVAGGAGVDWPAANAMLPLMVERRTTDRSMRTSAHTEARRVRFPMELLRGDDAAKRVAARQQDAAVVYLRHLNGWGLALRQRLALNERPAASRTPVSLRICREDGVTVSADPFHGIRVNDSGALSVSRGQRAAITDEARAVHFSLASVLVH